jgi:hypothetical protein
MTSVRRLISPFTRSIGLVECNFGRCAGGEAHVGEHVALSLVHQLGELLDPGAQLIGDLSPLAPGGFGIVLGEGLANECRDDAAALFAGMGQHIAHEVNAAALPRRAENPGDGGLQPLMGIRDDELNAPQTAPGEFAQKLGPEGLGLRRADRQA